MHLQTSLVLFQNRISLGEVVQNFKLKRVGGDPKGHPLAPLYINTFDKKIHKYMKQRAHRGVHGLATTKNIFLTSHVLKIISIHENNFVTCYFKQIVMLL